MLPNSLRTRGVNFAYLFGPPRMVAREEASRVHNSICDKLKLDDLSFRYSTSEPGIRSSSRGFSIVMERQEGRGAFRIIVDQAPGNPIRLLLEYHWPPSDVHVQERFDDGARTVFESLDGPWQRVLAEARVRAQCDVKGADATRFLRDECLGLPAHHLSALGEPVSFVSIGIHVSPGSQTQDPLEGPARELSVEILREDPKALYLELMSRWTQVPVTAGAIPLNTIRPISAAPSDYVTDTSGALNHWLRAVAEDPKE
jgi:hypothetical protein